MVKKTKSPKASKASKAAPAKPSPARTRSRAANPGTPSKKAKKEEPVETPEPEVASLVPNAQIEKAIGELQKWAKNNEKDTSNQLLEVEENTTLLVNIMTKKYYSDRINLKPKQIKLTNPETKEDFKTCLFVRDNIITTTEELEAIESAGIPTLKEVISLKQIKNEYKPFEKRRQLFSSYDMFVADDAILNSLPNTLGKAFYGEVKSKAPVRIKIVDKTIDKRKLSLPVLRESVEQALKSTFFLPPMGNNIGIKAGRVSGALSTEQLTQNVQDVINFFDASNVKSVFLSVSNSPSLPVYYAEKAYNDEDVVEGEVDEADDDEELDAAFQAGLLELADEDAVKKVLAEQLHDKKTSSKAKAEEKAHPKKQPSKK